ncbi:class I SAM-dependent methyltransferase [Sciscionella sediminilitoris]|uniref:class I SAM-dependent methyltransferase n=1 Tax=Sciscionella sediminilitoris TaxID=1445613 RepID=UPI0004DED914|nr:class I SAM-dependent methyltransferase [Sciscionella sp. SE31]
MAGRDREWDRWLYSGSAAYYSRGRMPYPAELAPAMATALQLDGSGRLLDLGCGPGSLTLPLAHLFTEAIGLDADRDMLGQAALLAARSGIATVRWLPMRAEELPAGLGKFRLITLAQSLHWMDRVTVLPVVRAMLATGGACAHVHATTHRGLDPGGELPYPRPPHTAITELVRAYLGPVRRAGRSYLPHGTPSGENELYRAAGFTRAQRIDVPGHVHTRVTEDVVAAVFSQSGSTPRLFGDRRAEFETALRLLLRETSPDGVFSERGHPVGIDIWRP